ncbi:MAG: LysR family transcriptional regulator [Myxococcaceae bacterium]
MTRASRNAPGSGPNLAAMDLNLLVAFEALWVERSVTAAGRRIGLSQPATSGALARLREMLGDRLFIRGKRGLEPTDRCTELAGPLTKALVDLRNVLAGSSFDPSTTTRQLRIGAVDAAIAVYLPRVLRRTLKDAPRAQVQVVAINPARATELLDSGALDLALSPVASPSATVRSRPLYAVEFVVALRPGHPLAKGKEDRAALLGFPRVHVAFEGMPAVKASVLLGSFLAVPPVLRESDAWALLPKPYADPLSRSGTLASFPPPAGVSFPTMQMQLLWPDAQDASPASRWLRGIIVDVTRPG